MCKFKPQDVMDLRGDQDGYNFNMEVREFFICVRNMFENQLSGLEPI